MLASRDALRIARIVEAGIGERRPAIGDHEVFRLGDRQVAVGSVSVGTTLFDRDRERQIDVVDARGAGGEVAASCCRRRRGS